MLIYVIFYPRACLYAVITVILLIICVILMVMAGFLLLIGVIVRDKGVGGHGINPRCRPCDHPAGNHGLGLRPEFSLSDI